MDISPNMLCIGGVVGFLHGHLSQQALRNGGCWHHLVHMIARSKIYGRGFVLVGRVLKLEDVQTIESQKINKKEIGAAPLQGFCP